MSERQFFTKGNKLKRNLQTYPPCVSYMYHGYWALNNSFHVSSHSGIILGSQLKGQPLFGHDILMAEGKSSRQVEEA